VCGNEVADYLKQRKQGSLDRVSERFGQEIELVVSREFRREQFKVG